MCQGVTIIMTPAAGPKGGGIEAHPSSRSAPWRPNPMWWRVQGSHWHTKSLIYLGLLMYQVSSYRQSYRQPTVLALYCSDNPVLRYGVDCQIMLNSGRIARVRRTCSGAAQPSSSPLTTSPSITSGLFNLFISSRCSLPRSTCSTLTCCLLPHLSLSSRSINH